MTNTHLKLGIKMISIVLGLLMIVALSYSFVSSPQNTATELVTDTKINNKPNYLSPKTLAEKVAPYIFDCCSSYPVAKKVNYINHKELANGRWKINLSVKWTSSATKCMVEIFGNLTVDKNGCNPKWKYVKSDKPLTCPIKPGCRYICENYFDECL